MDIRKKAKRPFLRYYVNPLMGHALALVDAFDAV